jgi:hypothetical protein
VELRHSSGGEQRHLAVAKIPLQIRSSLMQQSEIQMVNNHFLDSTRRSRADQITYMLEQGFDVLFCG